MNILKKNYTYIFKMMTYDNFTYLHGTIPVLSDKFTRNVTVGAITEAPLSKTEPKSHPNQ